MSVMNHRNMLDELEKYTKLTCDDNQEVCDYLTLLLNREHTFYSKNLYDNIVKELELQLKYFKETYNIVERERVVLPTKELCLELK